MWLTGVSASSAARLRSNGGRAAFGGQKSSSPRTTIVRRTCRWSGKDGGAGLRTRFWHKDRLAVLVDQARQEEAHERLQHSGFVRSDEPGVRYHSALERPVLGIVVAHRVTGLLNAPKTCVFATNMVFFGLSQTRGEPAMRVSSCSDVAERERREQATATVDPHRVGARGEA